MTIAEAQLEMRRRFAGGFYGQFVSGVLWLTSAGVAEWRGPRAAIMTVVIGGFFIFPVTELLLRAAGEKRELSDANALRFLGMQVAFVLPLSMPLLVPVGLYRLDWFFPALMILVGAHYVPFVFLYGMRMFAILAAFLVASGLLLAMYSPGIFSAGAWITSGALLAFAAVGKAISASEAREVTQRVAT